MLSLGTGGSDEDDKDISEILAEKMLKLLQEHGWDFTYGRDPVLILIEIEEGEDEENPNQPDEA